MYDTSECIQEEICDDWPDSERRRTILQRDKKNRRLGYNVNLLFGLFYVSNIKKNIFLQQQN